MKSAWMMKATDWYLMMLLMLQDRKHGDKAKTSQMITNAGLITQKGRA